MNYVPRPESLLSDTSSLADRPFAHEMFQDLLARLSVGGPARLALAALLNEPWRRYHGPGHVGLLWHRHLAHGGDPGDTVIAHAIAYHDAIYAVGANDNEVRSVNLWLAHAAALPATLREAVARAIMATADHPGRHPDAADQWLVDLDLTPLGEPWPLFAANSAALRAEAGLPHAAVTPKQAAFLRRLLDLPRIYRSRRGDDAIMHAYERTARGNLLRVLS